MFLCVEVMYDRMHSRQIADYGGVVNKMPKFAAFFMLFAMANAGLPATSGFVGEFMVILAAFENSFWIALLAGTSLVLGAAYNLWMIQAGHFRAVTTMQSGGTEGSERLRTFYRARPVLGYLAVAGTMGVASIPCWMSPMPR